MTHEQEAAGVRRPTLLLIDEHKIMREGIEELVKRSGDFEVIGECGSGMEAVHVFRARRADVIVMGSRLQDLDGIQATRLLLREFPTARIILLSAHEDEETVFRAIRSGALGFVLERSVGSGFSRRTIPSSMQFGQNGPSVRLPASSHFQLTVSSYRYCFLTASISATSFNWCFNPWFSFWS